VNKYDIGIPATAGVERLSGGSCDDFDVDTVFRLEQRQEVVKKTSCIDVVAATTMDFVCAEADVPKTKLTVLTTKQRQLSMMVTPTD
jgi:hypothetical protein